MPSSFLIFTNIDCVFKYIWYYLVLINISYKNIANMITMYNKPDYHINLGTNQNYETHAIVLKSSQYISSGQQLSENFFDCQQLSPAQTDDNNKILNMIQQRQYEDSVLKLQPNNAQIEKIHKNNDTLDIREQIKNVNDSELNKCMESDDVTIRNYKQSASKYLKDLNILNQRQKQLQNRIKTLQSILIEKDETLNNIQLNFNSSQIQQQQKIHHLEQKYKKLYAESKEQADKIRKSNSQLNNEKKINQELRMEMNAKIEQLQSNRQLYLVQQVQKLKHIIESSRDQREITLTNYYEIVSSKAYLFERQLRNKEILITLMERKKQQVVKDISEKKDKQIKIQKTLYRTLNQKYVRLQENIRSNKQKDVQIRSRKINKSHQQQIIFKLTPEKH